MRAATAPAKTPTFRCRKCYRPTDVAEMQLDAEGAEICPECYLKEPPAVDVDGVFAEVAASYAKPAKAELLAQLGAALGCVEIARPNAISTSADVTDSTTLLNPHGFNRGNDYEKIDGFPNRCWYNGPFEPAPRPPKVQLEYLTYMDREALMLAERGRADIIRFAQMMRRARGGK